MGARRPRLWRGEVAVEIGDVIGPPCSPRGLARLLLYGLELLGIPAFHRARFLLFVPVRA
jgi:hypothetical protein